MRPKPRDAPRAAIWARFGGGVAILALHRRWRRYENSKCRRQREWKPTENSHWPEMSEGGKT